MIPTTSRRSPVYTGTGAPASYAFGFKVFSKADIAVKVTDTSGNEATWALDTQYTVALNADQDSFPGGTVTPVTALTAGYSLVVIGNQAYSQTTQFPNGGAYNAVIAERAFDRIVVMAQQLKEEMDRTISLPAGEATGSLPAVVSRRGRMLGFDEGTGVPVVTPFTMNQVNTAVIAAYAAGAGSTFSINAFNLLSDAQKADVSNNVGAVDVAATIQQALDLFSVIAPFGGRVELPRGTWRLESASLKLSRGVSLVGVGKDATVLKVVGDHAGIEQKMINGGVTGAQNVYVADLKILGEGDAAKTNQHGLVCSSSLQYSTFERLLIQDVGAIGINAPVTPLGAIFNTFRDIEIISPRGFGHFIAGNYGQNVHERVRIFGGYSHGFVIDGTNNAGSNPLSNSFIGCAYESTNNTTSDVYGVWFVSDTLYNAYDTTFINCYFEPYSKAIGDSCAYRIGAAKGVKIIGGFLNFVHWGVKLTSQYSEGVYLQSVLFGQSPTWAGSANLAGKAMIDAGVSGATVHVGPQCAAQLAGGVTWDTLSAASVGRVWGYLDLQDKLSAGRRLTFTPAGGAVGERPAATSARRGEMWFTESAAGFADHAEVCIKKADNTYAWVSVGGQTDYHGTFAFGGVSVAAGTSQSQVISSVTGADLLRDLRVSPAVSLAGLGMTASPEGPSQIRLTFTNLTGSPIGLAAGTWSYWVQSA